MSAVTQRQEAVVIERAGTDAVGQLRGLWTQMQNHHAAGSPTLGATWSFRGPQESWRRRRASYAAWLAGGDAFLLLARCGPDLAGYLVGRIGSGWSVLDTGERIGTIESLSVAAHRRGAGIGTLLMARAREEFGRRAIDTVCLSVFAENSGAIRFYEGQGMVPATVTYFGRVDGQARQ